MQYTFDYAVQLQYARALDRLLGHVPLLALEGDAKCSIEEFENCLLAKMVSFANSSNVPLNELALWHREQCWPFSVDGWLIARRNPAVFLMEK